MSKPTSIALLSLGLACCAKQPAPAPPAVALPDAPAPTRVAEPSPPAADGRAKIQDLLAQAFQPVYFPFDQASLSPQARELLAEAARLMKQEPSIKVVIQGNTDDRGTVEYNLALGHRRAQVVKDYLMGLGIEAGRLQALSYGEERPATDGKEEQARSLNRRDEFLVSF